MKLSQLNTIQQLHVQLTNLKIDLSIINDRDSNRLGVTFHGKYQGEHVLNVVRPALAEYVQGQIAGIEAELRHLGVEIDS